MSGAGSINLGGKTLTLTAAANTYAGAMSGTGSLTINSGTEVLSGANTFSGGIAVTSGGTLSATTGGTSGTNLSTNTVTLANGTLLINGTGNTLSNGIALSSGGGTVNVANGNSDTLSGVIGGGAYNLTVNNGTTGTLTLTNTNTYTGTTTISGGTLALTGTGAIATSSGVADSGTFDISGTTSGASITTLSGNGGVTIGSKTLTLTAGSGSYGGVIAAGTGGLTVNGSGTETLGGVNLYTGATTIGAGEMLALSGSGSIAASSGVADSGTFDISGTTAGASVAKVTGAGNVAVGSKTLNLTSTTGGTDITGGVTTTGSGTGILVAVHTSGTDDFNTIGSSGHALSTFNMTGSGGTTVLNGNSYVTTTTVSSGATLKSGAVITLTGALINNGTLDVSAYPLNVVGSLNNSGTLNLGSSGQTVVGNITGTNGTITLTVNGSLAGTIMNTTNAANATFSTGLTLTPTVANGVAVQNQQSVVVIHANSSNALVNPGSIISVTPTGTLLYWTSSTGTSGTDRYGSAFKAQDLILTAGHYSAIGWGANPINAAGIDRLNAYTGSVSNVLTIFAAAQKLTTAGALNRAGAQLSPEVSDIRSTLTLDISREALDAIELHNSIVRAEERDHLLDMEEDPDDETQETGVSSGERAHGVDFWSRGFGKMESEGIRDGVDGYTATVGGAAFGGDMPVKFLPQARAGVSFAYANSSANETGNREGSGLLVNSYIGTLYGTYRGDPWYVDTSLTFGYHNYKSTRMVDSLGLGTQVATANFSGQQYGAHTEFGYPLQVAPRTLVTPFATVTYNYLTEDAYQESGATGINLAVASARSHSLRSGLGAKVESVVGSKGDWIFKPALRMAWEHEFLPDLPAIESNLVGGAPYATPGMRRASESAILGLGFEAIHGDGVTLSLEYNAEMRDQYLSNGIMMQARSKF